MMDMGVGETLEGGRKGAFFVLSLSVIMAIALGALLW